MVLAAGLRVNAPALKTVQKISSSKRQKTVTQAFSVPDQYGYVAASVATTSLVSQYLAVQVALARRRYNVAYPAMYAEGNSEDAQMFNCIQRSHQNMLEYLPQALALQMVMGMQFPIAASVLGVAWAFGRVVYAAGYSSGDPAKRAPGSALAGIVYLALIGGAFAASAVMVAPDAVGGIFK